MSKKFIIKMEVEQISSPTEQLLDSEEQQSSTLASELEGHSLENHNVSTYGTETIKKPNYILKKNAQLNDEIIIFKKESQQAARIEGIKRTDAYISFYGKPEEILVHFEKEENVIDKKESECKMVYTFKDLKLNKEYKRTFYLKKALIKEEDKEENKEKSKAENKAENNEESKEENKVENNQINTIPINIGTFNQIQLTQFHNHINSRKYSIPKIYNYPNNRYYNRYYNGYYNGYYVINFGYK